jgi:hypothetical protein
LPAPGQEDLEVVRGDFGPLVMSRAVGRCATRSRKSLSLVSSVMSLSWRRPAAVPFPLVELCPIERGDRGS